MPLSSIRSLNLLAMHAIVYIALPQFIFYAIGYALEHVLSMSHFGISSYLPPKVRSRQITLFEYFKIVGCGI